MNIRTWAPGLAFALLCSTAIPAVAADFGATDDTAFGSVNVWSSIGITYLKANEYVFASSGGTDLTSQLIWESTAPLLSAGFDVALPEGWTVAGTVKLALGGDSYMEDYDWVGPDFVSYDFDDWTHRSQHDATNLDWYFDGSLLLGRDFALTEGAKLNLNAGFKYTDIAWTAWGGEYVYSDLPGDPGGHYRDYVFSDPDSVKTGSYNQRLPAVIAGADVQFAQDAWMLDVAGHAGVVVGGSAIDNHWLRDLQITDTLSIAPIVSADFQASYAVADSMQLFVAGSAEQIFTARGDGFYDNATDPDFTYVDGKGADLFAASISAGIKGTF